VIGERGSCLEALEQAMESASGELSPDEFFASYCTPSYIEMESATCWVELGNADRAISTFERGLAQWPATQERDRGLCLSRLATAYAITGQPAEAVEVGAAALSVARATGSMRIAHQLSTLRDRLDLWRRMSDVAQLRSGVSQLPNSQAVAR
jgi:hypothetical protein